MNTVTSLAMRAVHTEQKTENRKIVSYWMNGNEETENESVWFRYYQN